MRQFDATVVVCSGKCDSYAAQWGKYLNGSGKRWCGMRDGSMSHAAFRIGGVREQVTLSGYVTGPLKTMRHLFQKTTKTE